MEIIQSVREEKLPVRLLLLGVSPCIDEQCDRESIERESEGMYPWSSMLVNTQQQENDTTENKVSKI